MKKVLIGVIISSFVAVGAVIVFNNSSDTNNQQSTQESSEESMQEYYSIIQSEIENGEAVLLDVRTEEEYASGHAKEAENFTLQDLQSGLLPDIDASMKIYVYCRSGSRSAMAKSILENNGFESVENLGGLMDVQSLGAEIVR